MSYPLRIENVPGHRSFVTSRVRNSELWFVNNPRLQERFLAYFAKYQNKYCFPTYALAFMGNHYHLNADFSGTSRASFTRDFNSMCARMVQRHVKTYPGGALWGRRYSCEALVEPGDIEEYFFYIALQPVLAGLCEDTSDYRGYNSFFDAIFERERKFIVTDFAAYNDARRYSRNVSLKDFQTKVTLRFARLPGYEHLSKMEYRELMLKKYDERRRRIIAQRKLKGLGFVGNRALRMVTPGSLPNRTKTSSRNSLRPLVLTKSHEIKRRFLKWYFQIYAAFKQASLKFRSGTLDVVFPPGTFRPPSFASP